MSVMDAVKINGLEVRCIVGVRPRERRRRQKIVIDVECFCNLSHGRIRDELNMTLDYSRLATRIEQRVASSSYFLIETLAEAIADLCLEEDLVTGVVVEVIKPAALRRARAASVRLARDKISTPDD
jgi:FolB domain-containing protein